MDELIHLLPGQKIIVGYSEYQEMRLEIKKLESFGSKKFEITSVGNGRVRIELKK